MKWRDMAEVSREQHPNSQPQEGCCYVNDRGDMTVALVDTRDPALGWAVWYVGGPTMRLCSSIPLQRALSAMALAELLGVGIRGVALFMRARKVVAAVLRNEQAIAAKERARRRRPGIVVPFEDIQAAAAAKREAE